MRLLRAAGALELAAGLCRDIAAQFPAAAWARRQLGPLLLAAGDAEGAVAALQVWCWLVLLALLPCFTIAFCVMWVQATVLLRCFS